MHKEDGFSLIELLFVMALTGILLTLGAFAARQFWFQRSLLGAQDQVTTQLRALQQRAIAEGTASRYYGAWFTTADADDENWGTVRFDSLAGTCTSTGRFTFDAGVLVSQVDFADSVSGVTFTTAMDTCDNLATIPDGADFVFFLTRGTATESTQDLVISQPRLQDRSEAIRVLGLTGRVEKV